MKISSSVKIFDKIYPAVFSILVFVILISFVSSPDLTLSTISTDFRWRKNLITLYANIRFKLGDRIYNGALVGKDGWLYFTGNRSIDDYQKVDFLGEKDLSRLQTKLDQLNNDLGQRCITLLVVIAPNKTTIYPQYMPDQIPVIGQKSSLDKFVEYMRQKGETPILDLRSTLLTASKSQDIYYKTDAHWNDVGAYYGYAAIMHALAADYPSLIPHPISDFEYKDAGASAKDLSLLMGLPNYKEQDWVFIPKFDIDLKETSGVLPYGVDYTRTVTNSDNQPLKLLVFHNLFYDSLSHFIEPHFRSVITIPFTNSKRVWSLDWIQRENPDIVIIEVVERYLNLSLPELLRN